MKRIDTLSQIIRRKSTIFFSNKRKKVKENALIDTKSLKFGQIICCKTYFTDKSKLFVCALEQVGHSAYRLDFSIEQHVGIALCSLHAFMPKQLADKFQVLASCQSERGECMPTCVKAHVLLDSSSLGYPSATCMYCGGGGKMKNMAICMFFRQ